MENAVAHPLFHLWLKIKHSFILYSSIVITICTDNEFIRLTCISNWYEYPTKNALRNFKIEEMMNCQRRENKSTWENGRIVKWLDKKIACLVVSFFLILLRKTSTERCYRWNHPHVSCCHILYIRSQRNIRQWYKMWRR